MNILKTKEVPNKSTLTESYQQSNAQTHDALTQYIEDWGINYEKRISSIPLFNTQLSSTLSTAQKQLFAKVFYHARGHFYKFLWLLGNKAPTKHFKEIILHNIADEFGGKGLSHEELYYNFCDDLGINIRNEFIDETSNVPQIQAFNLNHLQWLNSHCWNSCFAAFSAYEKLDNIDYNYLSNLAISLGVGRKGLAFFKIHTVVTHFSATTNELKLIWDHQPSSIKEAFEFIGSHQLSMWKTLSSIVMH